MRTQGSGPRNPGRRTRDPGTQDTEPQDPGPKIRDLSVYKTFMLKRISSHVAYSMYSIFLVIFEKHVLLLNFKIKRWKVRSHLQVNVITQSITSHNFPLFSRVKIFFWNFQRDYGYSWEDVHLTLPSYIFSVQVKSGACYITSQWARAQNKIKEI